MSAYLSYLSLTHYISEYDTCATNNPWRMCDDVPTNLLTACSEGLINIVHECIDTSNNAWKTLHALPRNRRLLFLQDNIQSLIVDSQWRQAMINACRNGQKDIIKILPQPSGNGTALYEAYKNGHDVAHLVKGVNGHEAFDGACAGGNINLVKDIIDIHNTPSNVRSFGWECDGCKFHTGRGIISISNGITKAGRNIDIILLLLQYATGPSSLFLDFACEDEDIERIQLFINRGITNWNAGLAGACRGGHVDIAQDMIRRGADNYEMALHFASREGHVDIIQLLKPHIVDWKYGLDACGQGHLSVVQLLKPYIVDWKPGLCNACLGGHIDIAKYIIANHDMRHWDISELITDACIGGNIELARLMIQMDPKPEFIDSAFKFACRSGSVEMINLLILSGARNLYDGLREACYNGNYEVVKMLIARGVPCQNLIRNCSEYEDNIHLINLILQNSIVPKDEYYFNDANINKLVKGMM